MDKSKYMQQLREEMQRVMERPVTLGKAEEITVYADAICALKKLGGEEPAHEGTKPAGFTEAEAKRWTEHMENDDGSKGPHWTLEQATAVACSSVQ